MKNRGGTPPINKIARSETERISERSERTGNASKVSYHYSASKVTYHYHDQCYIIIVKNFIMGWGAGIRTAEGVWNFEWWRVVASAVSAAAVKVRGMVLAIATGAGVSDRNPPQSPAR